MGIFSPGYTMHQYQEWLLTTVGDILDDTLAISSAGLLKAGAIAWVEVSVPDSITTRSTSGHQAVARAAVVALR